MCQTRFGKDLIGNMIVTCLESSYRAHLQIVITCPVEITINNVDQNLQSGQLHHWATSHGKEITTSLFAVINSSRGISNPYSRGYQPFRGIIQPFLEIQVIQPLRPFRRILHNLVCCQRTGQSLPPRLYDSSSYRELTPLVETTKQLAKS